MISPYVIRIVREYDYVYALELFGWNRIEIGVRFNFDTVLANKIMTALDRRKQERQKWK